MFTIRNLGGIPLLLAIGMLTLIPYWLAAQTGGEPVGTITWNSFVHVVMVAGVFTLLLVPQLERWVAQHVMSR